MSVSIDQHKDYHYQIETLRSELESEYDENRKLRDRVKELESQIDAFKSILKEYR